MEKKMTGAARRKQVAPALGLRERSKLDKQRRIMTAAREIFIEKGYEAATTREIAALAEVGIGTLFVYAKDKRELLMMIINDDLDRSNEAGAEAIDREAPLLEQVLAFFRARYAYWASEPGLARPAVRETADFLDRGSAHGPETVRFYARRPKTLAMLTSIVQRCQAAGTVAADIPAERVSYLFMTIYLAEVRSWLNQDQPQVEEGIARLRELLELAIRGMQPARPRR